MPSYLDLFTDAYIECGAWAEDVCDLPEALVAQAKADCDDFVEAQRDALDASGLSPGQAGHDFYLTRCGYGAGFWDRGLGALGAELSTAAQAYGDPDWSALRDAASD